MTESGWSSLAAINILCGAIVLTFGRKLFWLFVGFIGFISAMAGASMIVQALNLSPRSEVGSYLALVLCGIFIQTILYRRARSLTDK